MAARLVLAVLVLWAGNVLSQEFDHAHAAWDALVKKGVVLVESGKDVDASVELFHRVLGLDSVLLGFILPDENMHAPNEFIRLSVFERRF